MRRYIIEVENKIEKQRENTDKGNSEQRNKRYREKEDFMIKLDGMKKKMEWQDREKRRKNIMTKRLKIKSGKRREAMEEVVHKIGVKVDIRKIKE